MVSRNNARRSEGARPFFSLPLERWRGDRARVHIDPNRIRSRASSHGMDAGLSRKTAMSLGTRRMRASRAFPRREGKRLGWKGPFPARSGDGEGVEDERYVQAYVDNGA